MKYSDKGKYNDLIKLLSEKSGVKPASVQSNFRTEQSIEDFFDLRDLDVKSIATELGLSTSRKDFFKEIMRIYKENN